MDAEIWSDWSDLKQEKEEFAMTVLIIRYSVPMVIYYHS